MLVNLDMDQRFPDFFMCHDGGRLAEVDELTVRRWANAIHAYNKVQQEMRAAYNIAQGVDTDY